MICVPDWAFEAAGQEMRSMGQDSRCCHISPGTIIDCCSGEDRNLPALQFAICRRCPKAYHQKCSPRGISFEDDDENNVLQCAWDDLLPKWGPSILTTTWHSLKEAHCFP